MIAMIDAGSFKRLCEFVSAGITSEPDTSWIAISCSRSNEISFMVSGTASYLSSSAARVISSGDAWVSSKVLCELVSKIKCAKDLLITLATFDLKHLTIKGSGFEYLLPTSDRVFDPIASIGAGMGANESRFRISATSLLEVATNMKVIRESESDSDLPVCEIRMDGELVQFVSITRLRSVSTWVATQEFRGRHGTAFVANDHLQKMDKALKQAVKLDSEAFVSVSVCSRHVGFTVSEGAIMLRRVERAPSRINELINYCRDPKNVRAIFVVNGKQLKEAYDRLDAFGKRNQSSVHRVDFDLNLVTKSLRMQAFSSGTGQGFELIEVSDIKSDLSNFVEFAASGNKLADLLRISGYQKVAFTVCKSSVAIQWESGGGVENMAILAGLAIGRVVGSESV